jgi:hypothetical protein
MSLNFFINDCQEPNISDNEFGICDDENGTKAYTATHFRGKWIATVKNTNSIPLMFTPIDKCILDDNDFPGRGRCDGMLRSDIHLFLIELKNQQKGWKTDAIEQLESTIQFLKDNHIAELEKYKYKKAFACNKRHGYFQEIDNEFQLQFYRKHKFRIDAQAMIIVV